MEIGLKERLIGAAVLVILAAIVIPWVLKGGSAPSTTVTKPLALPAATTAAPAATYHMALDAAAGTRAAPVMATNQAPSSTLGSQPSVPAATPQTAMPSIPPSGSPAHVERTVATGKWVVQAGSYSSERNALAVEHKLVKRGYHAYISRYHTGGHTYFRVRVGPYAERASAERVVAGVSHAYGGHAQIVPNS